MQAKAEELLEHLFRHQSGQLTARLVAWLGFEYIDLIEDVVQDALLRALKTWPYAGMPSDPVAWLATTAKNRALDLLRRDRNWRHKVPALQDHFDNPINANASVGFATEIDDHQLQMMFACCDPQIPAGARVPLTLKLVCGFGVAEIAAAFVASEATIAQRLVRAKRRVKSGAVKLETPPPEALVARLDNVLQVLYLMFNEGFGAVQGEQLLRDELCRESLRLVRALVQHPLGNAPANESVRSRIHALAALIHLQSARLSTRLDQAGDLVLLAKQDRARWDQQLIQAGILQLGAAACGDCLSRYHLEAEISACHALAPNYAATNWQQILDCYDQLIRQSPSIVTAVNRVVAVLQVAGAEAAAAALDAIGDQQQCGLYYPYQVVRATISQELGQTSRARQHWNNARSLAKNQVVQRFLDSREQS